MLTMAGRTADGGVADVGEATKAGGGAGVGTISTGAGVTAPVACVAPAEVTMPAGEAARVAPSSGLTCRDAWVASPGTDGRDVGAALSGAGPGAIVGAEEANPTAGSVD